MNDEPDLLSLKFPHVEQDKVELETERRMKVESVLSKVWNRQIPTELQEIADELSDSHPVEARRAQSLAHKTLLLLSNYENQEQRLVRPIHELQ